MGWLEDVKEYLEKEPIDVSLGQVKPLDICNGVGRLTDRMDPSGDVGLDDVWMCYDRESGRRGKSMYAVNRIALGRAYFGDMTLIES